MTPGEQDIGRNDLLPIRLTIAKSSWLRRYVKVRRVYCKLHTKRVRLNKVAQHEIKYLLNCSVRIYQRIVK